MGVETSVDEGVGSRDGGHEGRVVELSRKRLKESEESQLASSAERSEELEKTYVEPLVGSGDGSSVGPGIFRVG